MYLQIRAFVASVHSQFPPHSWTDADVHCRSQLVFKFVTLTAYIQCLIIYRILLISNTSFKTLFQYTKLLNYKLSCDHAFVYSRSDNTSTSLLVWERKWHFTVLAPMTFKKEDEYNVNNALFKTSCLYLLVQVLDISINQEVYKYHIIIYLQFNLTKYVYPII